MGAGQPGALETIGGGMASAFVAVNFVYPLDCIQSCMGVKGGLQGNVVQVAKQIMARDGIKGLYRGLGATLTSDMIGITMGFFIYDMFNKQARNILKRRPTPGEKGLVGGCAACVSMSICMPFEVVFTRMRVSGLPGFPVYKNMVDCFVQSIKADGVRNLYRGAIPAYVRVFPMMGSSYFIYELLSKQSGVGGLKSYASTTK